MDYGTFNLVCPYSPHPAYKTLNLRIPSGVSSYLCILPHEVSHHSGDYGGLRCQVTSQNTALMCKDCFCPGVWDTAYTANGLDTVNIRINVCAELGQMRPQPAVLSQRDGFYIWREPFPTIKLEGNSEPITFGRFEESRCPSWIGLFNVSVGCLQSGNAFDFANTTWANAKCVGHQHQCVFGYQIRIKDPCYSIQCKSNTLHFNVCLLNSVSCIEAAPLGHPAKLWWQRCLPMRQLSNLSMQCLGVAWTLLTFMVTHQIPFPQNEQEK